MDAGAADFLLVDRVLRQVANHERNAALVPVRIPRAFAVADVGVADVRIDDVVAVEAGGAGRPTSDLLRQQRVEQCGLAMIEEIPRTKRYRPSRSRFAHAAKDYSPDWVFSSSWMRSRTPSRELCR